MITIKTMIAVPCMQTVPTKFLRSLEYMRRLPDTYTMIQEGTLIHDARNEFASQAILNNFDRVLWIDSDMVFDSDLLLRLNQDMDDNADMVTALCFKRILPTTPVIYSELRETEDMEHGQYIQPIPMLDYPADLRFRVAACGFAAVMTSVPLLQAVWDRFGPPFSYHRNLGEDFSFCWRVNQLGKPIWCDSRIRVGHIGNVVIGEETYKAQGKPDCIESYRAQRKSNPADADLTERS